MRKMRSIKVHRGGRAPRTLAKTSFDAGWSRYTIIRASMRAGRDTQLSVDFVRHHANSSSPRPHQHLERRLPMHLNGDAKYICLRIPPLTFDTARRRRPQSDGSPSSSDGSAAETAKSPERRRRESGLLLTTPHRGCTSKMRARPPATQCWRVHARSSKLLIRAARCWRAAESKSRAVSRRSPTRPTHAPWRVAAHCCPPHACKRRWTWMHSAGC